MAKFFVEEEQINQGCVNIIGEDVNHIKNVLRINIKDKIQICSRQTHENFLCEVIRIDKEIVECKILEILHEDIESNIHIHLFQGLPKAEKMEWIIEKCTELGVYEMTPTIMKRCVVKLDDKAREKKRQRWQKIAEIAAKQSRRNIIPKVNQIIDIKNIFEIFLNYDIVLVAYEKEESRTLKDELKQFKFYNKEKINIAVLIGPEGGFDIKEIEYLKANEVRMITLGKRILRTETAPIVLCSNILYELEN